MEKISERKVQLIDHSLLVSIPPVWAKICNLQKGDTVSLYVEGRKLIVMPMEGSDE